MLGTPEHDGTRSKPIDYDSWPLYQELEDAQSAGALVPFVLGLGLDTLAFAATILTVVVIGDGQATEGVPFTRDSVRRLLTSEPMSSSGAACLALAWRHRDRMLSL